MAADKTLLAELKRAEAEFAEALAELGKTLGRAMVQDIACEDNMVVSTVYLRNGASSPKGSACHSGYVTQNTSGVEVNDREDGRGSNVFYPWDVVARVEFGTGWR